MRIYLASFFDTRARLIPIAEQITAMGHKVTSTWLYQSLELPVPVPGNAIEYAFRDCREISQSHLLIVDTFDETHRGGREWEAGYATGLGMDVWIVGPPRNVFHCIAQRHYDTWEECLNALRKSD